MLVDGLNGHKTLTRAGCVEPEYPQLSSYKAYMGTIMRTLTNDEAERVNLLFGGMRGMLPEGDGFPLGTQPEPDAEDDATEGQDGEDGGGEGTDDGTLRIDLHVEGDDDAVHDAPDGDIAHTA